MIGRIGGAIAWAVGAALLLTAGLLFWVRLGAALAGARAGPAAAAQVETAFQVYARVVLLKGLLPALLLALLVWPLLDRGRRFSGRGPLRLALGIGIAAVLASVAVAAALMPLGLPGLPSVKFTGALNFALTCVEIAAAVLVAAWIPRSAAPRYAAPIVVALGVALAAGWASVDYWARARAREPAGTVASVQVPIAAPAPDPAVPSPLAQPPGGAPPAPFADQEFPVLVPERGEPGWEELERRRATAARIQKLIDAGTDATGPAVAGGLLAEGDPHPVYEDGELRGIELQNLRPDGLYTQLGLREGDLVQSINGVELDASADLMHEIATSRTLELSVERSDGTQDRIAVPLEKILEGIQSLE